MTLLEKSLADEKRRNEDLQFSVDEATFCGEELNVSVERETDGQNVAVCVGRDVKGLLPVLNLVLTQHHRHVHTCHTCCSCCSARGEE